MEITYCVRECGRGCTLSEYKRVVKKAEKAKKFLGDDWLIEYHDNLGWYADVISPNRKVYVHISGFRRISPYAAFWVDGSKFVGHGKTPTGAIRNLWEQFHDAAFDALDKSQLIRECL